MPILDFFAFLLLIIDRVLVPLIFALAFLAFIWGVFQGFILNATNVEKQQEARQFVLYGIIGFFLMISIWGITRIAVTTFGFQNDTRPSLPRFR